MTGIGPALDGALRAAGFACLTVAAALEAGELLGRRPEARGLPWTRAGFLLLGAALAGAWAWGPRGEYWPRDPRQRWGLLAWLICFTVLHAHRVKAFKGRPAAFAGLAGWALAAGAWFLAR